MKKEAAGKTMWAFSGGKIPLHSTGKEPDFVSQDKISILNTSDKEAQVKLIIYFSDTEPAGVYSITIQPERVRKLRTNDLINPHAIPLGVPYGCTIESNVPVVVQFTRQQTGQDALEIMGTIAYYQ